MQRCHAAIGARDIEERCLSLMRCGRAQRLAEHLRAETARLRVLCCDASGASAQRASRAARTAL
jgi:hypothetical protein